MRRPFRFASTIALLGLALAAGRAEAQWPPDSLVNLEVLPRDISVRQLVQTMAGFTRALGVRCTYCHMGEEGKPLATYDFASDEKATKLKARAMLRMVDAVNTRYLAALDDRATPPVQVACATCHRGVHLPRSLQEVLTMAYAGGGLDSLRATYDSLRQRYYGRAAYDFGEVPLADVAGDLRAAGHADDAVQLHLLNTTENPTSVFAWNELGGAYAVRGDTTKAISAFDKVLQLDPTNGNARAMVTRLRGKK
jgi:tetratricopeptide (TPR) repeat protein